MDESYSQHALQTPINMFCSTVLMVMVPLIQLTQLLKKDSHYKAIFRQDGIK
jgi:hypothetical protein